MSNRKQSHPYLSQRPNPGHLHQYEKSRSVTCASRCRDISLLRFASTRAFLIQRTGGRALIPIQNALQFVNKFVTKTLAAARGSDQGESATCHMCHFPLCRWIYGTPQTKQKQDINNCVPESQCDESIMHFQPLHPHSVQVPCPLVCTRDSWHLVRGQQRR